MSNQIRRLFTQIYLLDTNWYYHSRLEWTLERWQWRGTLHSPKLQHRWNLTIRLFSVIYQDTRYWWGGLTPLAAWASILIVILSWVWWGMCPEKVSSKWAVSENSGFNSYPSRPEDYLVKTWCDRQLWKAVITGDTVTRLSIPIRSRG